MISKQAKKIYDRERYLKRRISIFQGRKCKACEIPMISRAGAHKTRTYCRSCSGNRSIKRFINRFYYRKNRKRILERAKLMKRHENTTPQEQIYQESRGE